MITLSVIIVSYNTKEILLFCLRSLIRNLKKYSFLSEIIVVDNGSVDGTVKSLESLANDFQLKIIKNKKNLGFGKANNQGVKKAQGEYLLFLNSDVDVGNINFKKLIDFFETDEKIGVITPKLLLPNGKLDFACHRGFPNLWRSFSYFSGLERIFAKIPLLNKIFGGYHLLDKDFNKIHEIDSASGAFYLLKRKLFNQIGGFDEDFFMYGEDLDLSWRIKEKGYKVIFFPFEEAVHFKYQSGLSANKTKIKTKTKEYFYQAMKIFYKKHYRKNYPDFFNQLIYFLIDFKKRFL